MRQSFTSGPASLALQAFVKEHLHQSLITDALPAGKLASAGEVRRRQTNGNLYAALPIQICYQGRAFELNPP